MPFASNFCIKEIQTKNGQTIDFNYSDENGIIYDIRKSNYNRNMKALWSKYAPGFNESLFVDYTYSEDKVPLIQEISTPTYNIIFNYYNTGTEYKIHTIKAVDKSGQLIKGYEFISIPLQDYRAVLTQVNTFGVDESKKDVLLKLEYNPLNNSTTNLNYDEDCWDGYFTYSTDIDEYGYYNDNTQDHLFPAEWEYNGVTKAAADRDYDETKMQAGILKKIIIKDGGSIEYEYMANAAFVESEQKICYAGGLLIKSITKYDGRVLVEKKTFKYHDLQGYLRNGSEDGYLYEATNGFICFEENQAPLYNASIYSDVIFDKGYYYGQKEIFYGSETDNIGKKVIDYQFDGNSPVLRSTPLMEQVFDKEGNLKESITFTVKPEFPAQESYISSVRLIEKEFQSIYGGIHLQSGYAYWEADIQSYNSISKMYSYFVDERPYEIEKVSYKDGGSHSYIQTNTSIEYNDYGDVVEVKFKDRTQTVDIVLETKYMSDLNIPSSHYYYYLRNTNNFNAPVIKNKWKIIDGTRKLIESVVYKYDFYGNVEEVWSSTLTEPLSENQYSYPDFSGNNFVINSNYYRQILQIDDNEYSGEIYNLVKDTYVSYLKGYNKTQIIAEFVGLSHSELSTALNNIGTTFVDLQNSDQMGLLQTFSILRSALPDTFITSYTYKPLVGVTSVTDPNDRTIFYNFNDKNQLEYIKDEEFKILKIFEYNTYLK